MDEADLGQGAAQAGAILVGSLVGVERAEVVERLVADFLKDVKAADRLEFVVQLFDHELDVCIGLGAAELGGGALAGEIHGVLHACTNRDEDNCSDTEAAEVDAVAWRESK